MSGCIDTSPATRKEVIADLTFLPAAGSSAVADGSEPAIVAAQAEAWVSGACSRSGETGAAVRDLTRDDDADGADLFDD